MIQIEGESDDVSLDQVSEAEEQATEDNSNESETDNS